MLSTFSTSIGLVAFLRISVVRDEFLVLNDFSSVGLEASDTCAAVIFVLFSLWFHSDVGAWIHVHGCLSTLP